MELLPFKSLVTHGFVTDSQQPENVRNPRANVVDPNEVANKSGIEIVRLWTVYEDYGQDLPCVTKPSWIAWD